MEADKKTNRIEHIQYTIQYNDKAISNLKYNKQTIKRQRIKVRFKNGPRGISLRWTPKTNKKVFQLIFAFRGKIFIHDCGEFLPGSYGCNDLDKYLINLNDKHRNDDGTFKTNPNVDVITKKSLKIPVKTLGQVIELICKG